MKNELFKFSYEVYDSSDELSARDRSLLQSAQQATNKSHAPYSRFQVGAAALLANGEVINGGNQENASFPAGLCAEGVVLAAASAAFPGQPIETLAVSYHAHDRPSDHPISPCGICRQSLEEFKKRTGSPVRLILGGMEGKVIIVPDASVLMPLAFKF